MERLLAKAPRIINGKTVELTLLKHTCDAPQLSGVC
jgi:hypothetical protein